MTTTYRPPHATPRDRSRGRAAKASIVAAVISGLCGALAGATQAGAKADERGLPRTSLAQLATEGHAWLTTALAGASPTTGARGREHGGAPQDDRAPPSFFAPHVGVVVRDWRSSVRLAGAAGNVTDDVRPSGSDRMVLVRVAVGTRIAPFAEIGAGQWRLDPLYFPFVDRETELAARFGAGLELRLGALAVAAELHDTALYRERRAGRATPDFPAVLGCALAARATF